MTKYWLEVSYIDGRYESGWHWMLYYAKEGVEDYSFAEGARELCLFRWTAILGGRLAARKRERNKKRSTPYTKEFTI